MSRAGGRSCSTAAGDRTAAAASDNGVPGVEAATLEALPDYSTDAPPSIEHGPPAVKPEPQLAKERTPSDASLAQSAFCDVCHCDRPGGSARALCRRRGGRRRPDEGHQPDGRGALEWHEAGKENEEGEGRGA